MKKVLLLFILAVCAVTWLRATEVGHFCKDISAQNVSVDSLTNHFSEWFDLPDSTTFVLRQDNTDMYGIQHLNYQQFIGGHIVEGGRVIAHIQDGRVMYVNGVLLENHAAPAAPKRMMGKKRIQQISNSSSVEDCILTPVFMGDSVVYKYAYVSSTAIAGYDVYYDAETGEVLKKISTRYGLTSVQGTANTYYEGTKPITCSYDSSLYHLIDLDRQIYTFNGSKTPASLLNYLFPSSVVDTIKSQLLDTLPVEIQNDERLYEFYLRNAIMQSYMIPTAEQYVSAPTSATPSFSGTSITKVVIDSIGATAWQGEEAPEVFITIEDQNFIERYNNMAGRVTFDTLPVTFTLDVPLWADSYYLNVWAYGDTVDDWLAVFPLDQEEGTFGYGNTIGVHAAVTQTAGAPSPILDAHWGIQQTFDFYSDVFGRNSFDGLGSPIYQFVNVNHDIIQNGLNAFASFTSGESAYMAYGMGDGEICDPVVDLTISAHEYSHLITYFNSSGGLKYQNESGALSEGFSDLFAMCVENYVEGAPSWLLAHKGLMIGKSNMRSMSDPYQNEDGDFPCPKAYFGRYWIPSTSNPNPNTNDLGGVHTNSSVLNYWFYVLCEGGTFTNEFNHSFSVQGIGIEKAQVIAYLINQYYLTEYATFQDTYLASLVIANLIYGQGSEEDQSLQNAWGVVGIGNGYIATGVDNILNQNTATKCIIDGHFFILRDGHKFTVTGAIIE